MLKMLAALGGLAIGLIPLAKKEVFSLDFWLLIKSWMVSTFDVGWQKGLLVLLISACLGVLSWTVVRGFTGVSNSCCF